MASSLHPPSSSNPSPPPATTAAAAGDPWTEEDEVRLLEAALDFATEPVEAFDPTVSPFLRMERALAGRGFTRDDILAKVKELRRRYEETAREKREHGSEARGDLVLEISHKIWGREERKDGKKKEWEEERKEEEEEEEKTKKTRTKRRRKFRPLRDVYDNSQFMANALRSYSSQEEAGDFCHDRWIDTAI